MRFLRLTAIASGVTLSAILAAGLLRRTSAQSDPSDLAIVYGSNGIERLSLNGRVLEDLDRYPSDAFHIWHLKMTDLAGTLLTTGDYGWGENNASRQWNSATHTWTYTFRWGAIATQFVQNGSTLDILVTERNNADSGVILDGAVVYPFALHLPKLPRGFGDAATPQLADNATGPGVTIANFGSGQAAVVALDAVRPLYSGLQPTGTGIAYTPLIATTAPDDLATFRPHLDRPVRPGQTDTFIVSIRFSPPNTAAGLIASDAFGKWAAAWPPELHWTDRRPIGTVYLASSAEGDPAHPAGLPANPRRYFSHGSESEIDIDNPEGLANFQKRVLQQAATNVANLQKLGAQGAITWDLEGEQYPQSTSYVCAPDQIGTVAPEMESIIHDPASPFLGMKLDDAYFKTMRDAGFRVGVCVRPQHFTVNADGTAEQRTLPASTVAAELTRKMKYAHDRWGATLFYIDSTVEPNGAVLDAAIFESAAKALPDSLLIPEETTPKHFAYTAPFRSFLFHHDLGTDASIYAFYPQAFSANLVNDADPALLAGSRSELVEAVWHGDILMLHVDYWHPNNALALQIYKDAALPR